MSQLAKMKHSRHQWKAKAKQRRDHHGSLRQQLARVKAERAQAKQALKATPSRLRQLASHTQAMAVRPQVDVVWLCRQLFVVVRISFRAVCRVLTLLGPALGMPQAPCPPTVSNWVSRLSIGRIEAARERRGLPLRQAPCSNGLLWMIDLRIGLGSGKMVAVLALDAHHHHLVNAAPSLNHVHCIAVSVADAWPGAALAGVLKRLIAQMGRPAAYLQDGGSELQKAADLLEEQGLGSAGSADLSPGAANRLKRSSQHHPPFERFLAAYGRVSGQLKHTLLACWAPPTVRTKARFLSVHRLFTWADRLLKLSPAGGTKAGSVFARLRACCDALPACKGLIKRFRAEAQGLLACQQILKPKGLSHDTLAQCKPLISEMPSASWRLACAAYLEDQLDTAKTVGLAQVGLPISSDTIASLCGVAKRHGVGQTQDAARIALRLPALCGVPTRAEAEQVLGIRVARQHEITGQCTSLTKQRREVLGHGKDLERLGQSPGEPHMELFPRPKTQSNHAAIVHLSMHCEKQYGPHLLPQQPPCVVENVGLPDMREAALTSGGQKPVNGSRPI